MITFLNSAINLKIFSPTEPLGIFIIFIGLLFSGMIFYIIYAVSTNKESLARPEPGMHMRRTRLDDIPDNFVERMMGSNSRGGEIKKNKQVKIPEGFAVSIAYNKGGYQVVPKEDL